MQVTRTTAVRFVSEFFKIELERAEQMCNRELTWRMNETLREMTDSYVQKRMYGKDEEIPKIARVSKLMHNVPLFGAIFLDGILRQGNTIVPEEWIQDQIDSKPEKHIAAMVNSDLTACRVLQKELEGVTWMLIKERTNPHDIWKFIRQYVSEQWDRMECEMNPNLERFGIRIENGKMVIYGYPDHRVPIAAVRRGDFLYFDHKDPNDRKSPIGLYTFQMIISERD